MALEDINVTPSGLLIFTDRTADGFCARIALTPGELIELLNALPADIYDGIIAATEKKTAADPIYAHVAAVAEAASKGRSYSSMNDGKTRNSHRHPSPASPQWETATPGCVDENY